MKQFDDLSFIHHPDAATNGCLTAHFEVVPGSEKVKITLLNAADHGPRGIFYMRSEDLLDAAMGMLEERNAAVLRRDSWRESREQETHKQTEFLQQMADSSKEAAWRSSVKSGEMGDILASLAGAMKSSGANPATCKEAAGDRHAVDIIDLFIKAELVAFRNEALSLIAQGGLSIDGEPVKMGQLTIDLSGDHRRTLTLRRGPKQDARIVIIP